MFQQQTVLREMRGGLVVRLFGVAQIVLQLAQTLLTVLNALLNTRHVAAQSIKTRLHLIKGFGAFVMAIAQPLNRCIGVALFRNVGFELYLLRTNFSLTALRL